MPAFGLVGVGCVLSYVCKRLHSGDVTVGGDAHSGFQGPPGLAGETDTNQTVAKWCSYKLVSVMKDGRERQEVLGGREAQTEGGQVEEAEAVAPANPGELRDRRE